MRNLRPIVAGVVLASACAVESVTVPGTTGPSEFGVSLAFTATPDVIRQDGASTSTIGVTAFGPTGQPMSGLMVRLDVFVGNTKVDFGTLASKVLITGSDGKASTLYHAPAPPPPSVSTDTTISIQATIVGNNSANSMPRVVALRLVRPGVILPPNAAPVASFVVSPSSARENETLIFDASASRDDGQIVGYEWSFGDGDTASGRIQDHTYAIAGTYVVTLTVTDDRGATAMSASTPVTIVAAANPTATFTFSPTEPVVGSAVTFNAIASTVPTGRELVAFAWDFGDGAHGAGISTSHTFTRAGTFTVVLVVTDNTGRRGVLSRTVAVGLSR